RAQNKTKHHREGRGACDHARSRSFPPLPPSHLLCAASLHCAPSALTSCRRGTAPLAAPPTTDSRAADPHHSQKRREGDRRWHHWSIPTNSPEHRTTPSH